MRHSDNAYCVVTMATLTIGQTPSVICLTASHLLRVSWDCGLCGRLSHSRELLPSSNSLTRIEAYASRVTKPTQKCKHAHWRPPSEKHTCTWAANYIYVWLCVWLGLIQMNHNVLCHTLTFPVASRSGQKTTTKYFIIQHSRSNSKWFFGFQWHHFLVAPHTKSL